MSEVQAEETAGSGILRQAERMEAQPRGAESGWARGQQQGMMRLGRQGSYNTRPVGPGQGFVFHSKGTGKPLKALL